MGGKQKDNGWQAKTADGLKDFINVVGECKTLSAFAVC